MTEVLWECCGWRRVWPRNLMIVWKDPCCFANCTFKPGAACVFGLCCQTCQTMPSGEVCREESSECDLPEWCNGTSHECADDVCLQDGIPCKGSSHCYRKRRNNHDEQCRQIFGQVAKSANQVATVTWTSEVIILVMWFQWHQICKMWGHRYLVWKSSVWEHARNPPFERSLYSAPDSLQWCRLLEYWLSYRDKHSWYRWHERWNRVWFGTCLHAQEMCHYVTFEQYFFARDLQYERCLQQSTSPPLQPRVEASWLPERRQWGQCWQWPITPRKKGENELHKTRGVTLYLWIPVLLFLLVYVVVDHAQKNKEEQNAQTLPEKLEQNVQMSLKKEKQNVQTSPTKNLKTN